MVLWWYVCVCALDVDSNTFGARPPEFPSVKRLRVVTISIVRLVCVLYPFPSLCHAYLPEVVWRPLFLYKKSVFVNAFLEPVIVVAEGYVWLPVPGGGENLVVPRRTFG